MDGRADSGTLRSMERLGPQLPDGRMSSPSTVELEVRRIRALVQERRFAEAAAAAQALAATVPENRDVLYLRALAQRQLGEIPAALATLGALEQLHPRFSRLYQERGHCYVVLKQAPEAIEAFLRAVHMNPALPASWSMLEGLYRMTGQADDAATAAAHVATLKRLPPEVVTATALFSDGDLAAAEQLVRAFLLQHGHQVEAMRLLARIGIERDVLDDAELLLEGVLELAAGLSRGALRLRAGPGEAAHVRRRAGTGATAARRGCVRSQLPHPPGDDLRRARAARTGDRSCTGTCCPAPCSRPSCTCRSRTRSRPSDGARRRSSPIATRRRHALRSAMPTGALRISRPIASTMTELAQMRAAEAAAATSRVDRYHLCFALGKALEDRGAVRGVLCVLRARQRAQARRQRLPPGGHRAQYAPADRSLHARTVRAEPGQRRSRPRPDLHRRPAALRLDPDRADPRLALGGRRHARAGRHPPHGGGTAGPRVEL